MRSDSSAVSSTATAPSRSAGAPRSSWSHVVRSGTIVLTASLAAGALTSWAQGLLPDAVSSFANSVSGWTLVTAVVVGAVRPGLRLGALWGTLGFVALVLGYTAASSARGLTYDPTLWGAVGVAAGPVVGAAAAAIVGHDALRRSLGAGVLAGVFVADGVRGLTVVADTTSPVYWWLCLVGAVLLSGIVGHRSAPTPARLAMLAATALTASVLLVGFRLLG